jgi:ferredoxin
MNRRSFIVAASVLTVSAIVRGSVKSDKNTAKEKVVRKPALIDQKECIHCGTCFKNCPVKAIGKEKINGIDVYTVDPKKCISCGTCIENCPIEAIAWTGTEVKPDSTAKKPAGLNK